MTSGPPCACVRTSAPEAFPPTYDQSTCPTHGPSAPRYFVDHGTIHDRITGKHVETDEAAALLNAREPLPAVHRLTDRELQIARALALGATNREVANLPGHACSVKTVDTHRGHILKKLGLRNNAELARWAIRHGLVELGDPATEPVR